VENANRRFGSVEKRNGAAALFLVPVHVGQLLTQQAVGMYPDLMRSVVIDP
jgi:hypothetical protein